VEKDFQLGGWTVRPALNRLESDTHTVPVEPRVMDLLVYLFEHAGEVLPKDQIIRDVWGGAFVTDQALTYAVAELRKALGDDAHAPKFVRTVPKRGYQLIKTPSDTPVDAIPVRTESTKGRFSARSRRVILVAVCILLLTIGYVFVDRLTTERAIRPSLAQLTFGEGLQTHATWSPEGRFIAFAWNRDGNFDLFIQALDGSEPIRLTDHPAHDTQPSWSPDGGEIVFRSERDGGGLFITPAFGGPVRRICTFGQHPLWSPNGSKILFVSFSLPGLGKSRVYLVDRNGNVPEQIAKEFGTADAGWHPSGDYVCIWGIHLETLVAGLHLIPVKGGSSIFSDWKPMAGPMTSPDRGLNIWSIHWAPSGDEIFFEANCEGVSNLWRVSINPQRFEWGAEPERLTRGSNLDTDIAVSPSGQRLAFTSQTQRSRAWLYPFDVATGTVTGEGRRVGPPELNVMEAELSPEGERLLLMGMRGRAFSATIDQELCQIFLDGDQRVRSLDTNRGLLAAASWSRNGRSVAYQKLKVHDAEGRPLPWGESTLVMQPAGGGTKRILSHTKEMHFVPQDWSSRGDWLLCSTHDQPESAPSNQILRKLATDGSQRSSEVVLAHPDYDILSPRFSPDDRWICFVAMSRKNPKTARLYLAPASGGDWTALVPEEDNVSQIHWSPDGRLIYCLARREAGAALLAIPLDPLSGRQSGAPRDVMSLDELGCLPEDISAVRFCVAPGHLVVQKIERTGNIWMTTTRPD